MLKEILPLAAGPSRYLGTEVNSIHKKADGLKLRMALAFPDLYDIGMSHFGIQILYHILNQHDRIWAERVFAPGLDMVEQMKKTGIPLCSLESATPLSHFDIIGFSLLYELNYTNVLLMLDLAGIPFYASRRDNSHPIIIAGGPCTVNPEPVADFFDAMLVGDGEQAVVEMARVFMEWKDSGSREKTTLLGAWGNIEGVYIPSLFSVSYDASGQQLVRAKTDKYARVNRAIVADLDAAVFPDSPVVAFGRPVHDRLRLELARGCTRGCRFCQAGIIYRPVRERSLSNLLELTEKSLAATGYEDISLLSLSTGDYGCLSPLMQQLFSRYSKDHIAISLPSFRAGTLTPDLMDLIQRIRKTGFTIAPEAGTDRLRAVINKNITETEIIETIANAFLLGWRVIKLYFMIGLPTETDEDIDAIIGLVNRIKSVKIKGGRSTDIHVSVSIFVPKTHTPFQWEPQIALGHAKEKIEALRRRLKIRGVHFKWQKPETSLLEGVFARGDRRLSHLIESAYLKGCRFDGWSDSFNFKLWEAAAMETGIDMGFYTTRKRNFNEALPWDHIDIRVSKEFLTTEYHKAIDGQSTSDCRGGICQGCGICDFEKIMPRITTYDDEPILPAEASEEKKEGSEDIRIHIFYEKMGPAKYFGHLELANIFYRAIRRACVPVKFSKGFHPKPKISFHDALPVGMESAKEVFRMTLTEKVDFDKMINALNKELPEGLNILGWEIAEPKSTMKQPDTVEYDVTLSEGEFDLKQIQIYNDANEWILCRQTHKGDIQQINLKESVDVLSRQTAHKMRLKIKAGTGKKVRPAEAIQSIFKFSDDLARRAEIVKIYESNFKEQDFNIKAEKSLQNISCR